MIHDQKMATAIIGMGKTGKAVASFLMRRGIACEAFDESPVNLPEGMDIVLHTGSLDAELLKGFARLVVSPGINWQHPAMVQVRAEGVPVFGDLELFREAYHGDLIAITGTNGKTTTVSLISTMLDILSGGIEAGGNIGVPMLELLGDSDAQHPDPQRIVLELSSFQLERANPIHPQWAVLLNVQPDHADMHADMDTYKAAKLRMFANQTEGDKAMLPADACWNALADELRGRGVYVRRFGIDNADGKGTDVQRTGGLDAGLSLQPNGSWQVFWHHYEVVYTVSSDELLAQGQHQHLNLACAAQAAADFGISASVIRQSLTSFRGLPHRLQSLGPIAGREWYNDSKATNPDAAKAALESFHQVVWICGGLRKGLDISVLKDAVADHVEHMLVIGTDMKPFMGLAAVAGVQATFVKTVEQAVKQAVQMASGAPVLLSPAAASQDQFKDYIERGNAFITAVNCLEQNS
ncbi:MAG: UDP-N-acetylmuramoyl-L-alanine--D-glutamate ligase [Mariprofundus sp.]|nr:UDP-N-acetylmuramoyl-L-alanine--D-glutamate ligase [Mariprofundus sp.]